ncbi:hypothetical protein [Paraburkholderia caribensis]|uniref:hypothetical protein n=1 Tax=Paraburkholderia caribensis TaxID=75105 RepID=UPI000AAD9862|nr:hypothetical protein [Paraburkholderia caribensis]
MPDVHHEGRRILTEVAVRLKTEKAGGVTLERRLVELAWTYPDFAEMLERDPRRALKTVGVEVSPDVKIDIRQQRPDTLYFVIPPLAARQEDARTVINQMDLWQSGELFCWIMPQTLKLELLRMRQSFRRNNQ